MNRLAIASQFRGSAFDRFQGFCPACALPHQTRRTRHSDLRRLPDGWKIIHDHSSVQEPQPPVPAEKPAQEGVAFNSGASFSHSNQPILLESLGFADS